MDAVETIKVAEMYHATRAAACRSEALNQSAATQNKKWKAVFKLEDELKARGVY